jgi:hypothetical protein
MKKIILTLVLCAALALPAGAVYPVYDAPLHIQTLGDQIANFAKATAAYIKQTEQYIAEHTTALKEIQQVENQIVQLERMGDPKAFGANLPGVQVITGLAQIYQQGKQDAEDWAAYANPQAFKLTAEQVMGLYSNSLTGLTTSGGFKIPPAQGLIQFSLSDYNVATGAQGSITKLIATKTSLTQARDAAMAQVAAGGTDAEVQKLQATVSSLNGAIAGVDASIQQAVATANLQQQKNQAAEHMYQSSVTVQSVNTLNASVKTEIGTMEGLSTGFGDAPHWGGN